MVRARLWLALLPLAVGCVGTDTPGPLSGEELADLEALGSKYLALRLDDHRGYCLPDDSGFACDPNEESTTADTSLVLALSFVDGSVSACAHKTITSSGSDYALEDETVRSVPPGQVRAAVVEDELALTFALAMGMDLDDPFNDEIPTSLKDPRQKDHDGDRKPGISYRSGVGKIQFGLRLAVAEMSVDLGDLDEQMGGYAETPVDLLADFVIYDDGIPFVDVREKVEEALAERIEFDQQATLRLQPIASNSCDVAVRAVAK